MNSVDGLVADIENEAPLSPGQIRLLAPEVTPDAAIPLYVAILKEWEKELFLVAPYGRFSEPGTTGELLTGREESSLRVLCLWNAHTVASSTVAQSWFIDELSEEEAEQAWQTFRHVATGADLDESLQQKVGPPILHAEDPRIEYQEQETSRMSAVMQYEEPSLGISRDGAETPALVLVPWIGGYEQHRELALVAQTPSIYDGESLFHVAGQPLSLCVRPHSNWRDCVCLVVDDAGEPSESLDGYRLKSARGETSAPIQKSQVVVSAAILRDGFTLLNPSGVGVDLESAD